jgi:hypothetical protein
MKKPTKFRLGDWVEWDDNFGHHVGRIDPPCADTAENSCTFDGKHSFGWQPGNQPEGFREWEPRDGDRVRVTKCETMPEAVGMVGKYQAIKYRATLCGFQLIRDNDVPWNFAPGDAEFEPVFGEPTEQDVAEYADELKKHFSGLGIDCGELKFDPYPFLKEMPRQEPAEPAPKTPADRYAARKAMALEVLNQPWSGRRERT